MIVYGKRPQPFPVGRAQDEYVRDEDKATFATLKEDFIAALCKDSEQRRKLR